MKNFKCIAKIILVTMLALSLSLTGYGVRNTAYASSGDSEGQGEILQAYDDEDLDSAKQSAIEDIRYRLLGVGNEYENPLDNYRSAQQTEIRKIASDAETAINEATSIDDINKIKNNALDVFSKLFTSEDFDIIDIYYEEELDSINNFGTADYLEIYSSINKQVVKGIVNEGRNKLKALYDNAYGPYSEREYDFPDDYVNAFSSIYGDVFDSLTEVESRQYVTELIVKVSPLKSVYNGKVQRPKVTVIADGVVLPSSEYRIIWPSGMKDVGEYCIVAELIDTYMGDNAEYFEIIKAANPMKASGKTVKIKASKVKKKNQTVTAAKAFSVSGNAGSLKYSKVSGNKKITVASNGKVTVKKGLKKGTYKIKVKVTAKGNKNYKSTSKTVTMTIKVS